jgi:hypothetical protein
MFPSYARSQPTSRPALYELILVNLRDSALSAIYGQVILRILLTWGFLPTLG